MKTTIMRTHRSCIVNAAVSTFLIVRLMTPTFAEGRQTADGETNSTSLEDLTTKLESQTRRIDRLYRVLDPFMEELERQGAEMEREKREARQRGLNEALALAINEGRHSEALSLLEGEFKTELNDLGPTNTTTLLTLRRLMDLSGCLGDWTRSAKYARQLLQVSGPDVLVERSCAVASLLEGDEPGYREICARMLKENADTQEAVIADRTAKTCFLAPNAVPDLKAACRLAALSVTLEPDIPWFHLVNGMAEYRIGNAPQAMHWMDDLRSQEDPRIAAMAGFIAAMARADAGSTNDAALTLKEASKRLDEHLRTGNLGSWAGERWWFDAAAAIVVRAEAERKILGREASPRPTPASLAAARQAWWVQNIKLGCAYPVQLLQSNAYKASWSPDSKQIAFAKQGGGLAILEVTSWRFTDLVPKGKDPAWSPDGKHIAYVTEGAQPYVSEEVWMVPATGGNPVKVGDGGFPGWTADSSAVIFHSRKRKQILSARVDTLGESPSVFFESLPSFYPAVSPDGSRIAFGVPNELVVVDRTTGNTLAKLATPGERGLLPCWSPDGGRIAFGGFTGSRAGLWIFDIERGGAFQVATNPGCTMPAWSPDGESIAFDSRGKTSEIWAIKTRLFPRELALVKQLPAPPAPTAVARETSADSLVGKPVPGSFKLSLLNGGEFVLPDTANTNILLLDFWATWCGPCRQVMPTLAEIAQEYAPRGVRYVGVDLREKPEIIRSYLEKAGLQITVALDTEGKMAEAFLVRGIPTMVLVDQDNFVRNVHVGASPDVGEKLRRALDDMLGEKGPPGSSDASSRRER